MSKFFFTKYFIYRLLCSYIVNFHFALKVLTLFVLRECYFILLYPEILQYSIIQ